MANQENDVPAEQVAGNPQHNQDQNGDLPDSRLKVINKAMELPLMSGLTSTVAATSEYIYGTRPMTMMADKIKDVGERDDVKSVISSMNIIYTQNLEKRVSDLKVSLNPTVQKMDDYACVGIDKVNEKISETNETYMAPILNKMSESKEAYVDPIITKAVDIKDKTTQMVSTASEKVASARTNYVDPACKTAEDLKETYVEPAVKVTQEYIAPIVIQAYKDPTTAYGDMVNLSKEMATIAKDKTVEHAENAREYLKTTRESMSEQFIETSGSLYEMIWEGSERLAQTSLEMAAHNRDIALKLIREKFPEQSEALDENMRQLSEAYQAAYDGTISAAEFTAEASKSIYSGVVTGVSIATITFTSTKDFISDVTERLVTLTNQFLSTHENNIRYIASVFGMSSFVGVLGYSEDKKTI